MSDRDGTIASDIPPAGPRDAEDAAGDMLEAIAALVADEGAHEVDAPAPETLTSPAPHLEDIPDAAPIAAGAASPASPETTAPLSPVEADAVAQAASAPASPSDDPASTAPLDAVEIAALAADGGEPSQTLPFAPVKQTSPASPVAQDRISGAARGTGALAWGSRTDVGCVRPHNEDSFVIRFPLFAVADGMGGHAAGEVASTIAVSTLATEAPGTPDHAALGAAVEAANKAVLEGAANGVGRAGMGTTCTAVVIDGSAMAVGHVGDSRCYLLHAGQLVRVTHDHSYLEELVAAGEITPEEARVHPNRSVITRALGSDPNMKADHFSVDVARGDRVMLCSDGLSSMVTDAAIEEAMVCSPAPQACADALVDLALEAGGHDNVTCIVVDVKDDGIALHARKARLRNLAVAALLAVAVLAVSYIGLFFVSQRYWYLGDSNGYVAIYQGFPGMEILGLSHLETTTSVETAQLSNAVATRLERGVTCNSEDEAYSAVENYREQIAQSQTAKAEESRKVSDAKTAASAGSTAEATSASASPSSSDDASTQAQAETGAQAEADTGAGAASDQASSGEGETELEAFAADVAEGA